MDCPATIRAVRKLTEKWPTATAKLVEDKANGPAVMAMLRHEVEGLIPVNPEGGKGVKGTRGEPADRGWERVFARHGPGAVDRRVLGGVCGVSERTA